MKLLTRLMLLMLMVTGILISCKKPVPKLARYIPVNASFVASVNGASIKSKLKKSQGDLEKILKNMSVTDDTALDKGKREWQDIKNAGIDMDDQFYVWALQKEGVQPGNNTIIGALGNLDDANKFAAYLTKKLPGIQILKEKDFTYMTKDGDMLIAWNKEVILVLNNQNTYTRGMEYDSTTGNFNLAPPPQNNLANNLKALALKCFTQKENESVAAIPEFRDLAQEKADASFWANPGSVVSQISLPLPKLKELFENNYTAATLLFNDGAVVVNSRSYTGKPLKDIFEKYAGPKVDLDLVKRYPSSNINGFMVFAFDPQIISGIVKYMEVGSFADGFLTKFMGSNYTLNDLLKAFKGDIAVTVSDISAAGTDSTQRVMGYFSAPKAKMIFTMTVGDKQQMNKIMDRLVTTNMLEKVNGIYKPAGVPGSFGLSLMLDDKNLTLASNEKLLGDYTANKSKASLKNGAMDDFSGKAGVVYIDIESLLNAFPSGNRMDAAGPDPLLLSKQTFKDFRSSLDNFNGKYTAGHMELRFKDEKTNSLTTLLKLAAQTSEISKNNKPAWQENRIDSTQ